MLLLASKNSVIYWWRGNFFYVYETENWLGLSSSDFNLASYLVSQLNFWSLLIMILENDLERVKELYLWLEQRALCQDKVWSMVTGQLNLFWFILLVTVDKLLNIFFLIFIICKINIILVLTYRVVFRIK